MEQRKYTAFISYRHDKYDSFVAKTLHTEIEKFKIPKGIKTARKNMGLVFRDEEELSTASDLSEEIRRALDHSEFLIVICSERTVQSKWVPKEIDYFLQHHDRKHILAVLVSGEPEDVFPAQLTPVRSGSEDDQTAVEPLALDIRAKTRAGMRWKIKRELPRILASLIPCNYADLAMREQKRRFFATLSATSLVLAIALGFSGMLMVKNEQIAQKNEALILQKAEVQLRESQLLTLDAQEALADGQYSQALEYALAALPKTGDEDRPYYAPAERILMDAMNVFGNNTETTVLGETTLEQMTPVADFAISKDGTRVVAVDDYGNANCFSAENGCLLWSHMVSDQAALSPNQSKHVIFRADQKAVICNHSGILEAYDVQNGQCLWSYNLRNAEYEYLFYHEKTDVLLYAECNTWDYMSFQHHLHVLSAQTGQLLQTVTLTDDVRYDFVPLFSEGGSAGGVFSEDGTMFYGVFYDAAKTMHCFAANLTLGTAKIIYRHDTPGGYDIAVCGMDYDKGSNTLLLAVQDLEPDCAMSLLKIDCSTGALQWQTNPEVNTKDYALLSDGRKVLFHDGMIIAAVFETMFNVDSNNGNILASAPLSGVVTALQMVNDTTFGFAVDDTYAIGWPYGAGSLAFSSDNLYQISAPIADHQLLRIWEGGIVQRYRDGSLITLSISNLAGPGYIAYVPADRNNTICITRPVEPPTFADRISIEVPDKSYSFHDNINAVKRDHRILLGPMSETSYSTYGSVLCMMSIDTETQTLQPVILPEEDGSFQDLFPLSDGIGYVISTYDSITAVTDDNDAQTLFSMDLVRSAADQAGKPYYYSAVTMASEYQTGSETLLSAATDMHSLTLWQDGRQEMVVSLPTHLHMNRVYTYRETRLLKVGRNGWVLTSFHQENHDVPMESLAVYDTAQDRWVTFIHDTTAVGENCITLAEEKPFMAALDTNGIIRIHDLDTGTVMQQISTPLSVSSVAQMDFLLDDSFLILRTTDNQIYLYDIAGAAMVYRDRLGPTYDTGDIRVFEDDTCNRLYLAVGCDGHDANGLCLEMGSWTCLGYINGMLYFDNQSGVLYQYNASLFGNAFSCAKIPGTSALVQAAEKMIQQ